MQNNTLPDLSIEKNIEEKKQPKYSKRKMFLAGLIGAFTGIVAYVIYENLDQETKENFNKHLTKAIKNILHNILPNE